MISRIRFNSYFIARNNLTLIVELLLLNYSSYLLRSRIAPSLASFNAVSKALTRSIVALKRFSNFGNSQRKSALSLTSCLWTLVSWSKLFSKNEIFCFCANVPPSSSFSSELIAFLMRAWKFRLFIIIS